MKSDDTEAYKKEWSRFVVFCGWDQCFEFPFSSYALLVGQHEKPYGPQKPMLLISYAWLSACRLWLNAAKTQLLWLGSSQLVDRVDCHDALVLGTRVAISDTARDLGVVIDRELSLAAHVTAVYRSGYNQLRQLWPVVWSLTVNATKTLVQALISCRLDYCNSLLFGISDGLLRRLQSVQNAAARLVTGARRCDHITPVLRQLHWLPVRQRVVFKIAGLVHQSLVGLAPAYLADDCRLLSDIGRRPLQSNSNDIRKLLVPRTHNKLRDRSFSAGGPRLWNDLPPGLRRPGLTFNSFRQSLTRSSAIAEWPRDASCQ